MTVRCVWRLFRGHCGVGLCSLTPSASRCCRSFSHSSLLHINPAKRGWMAHLRASTQTRHESGGNFPSVLCGHVPPHHPVQFVALFKINSVIRKQHFPSDQINFLIRAAAFDHFSPPRDGVCSILPQLFSRAGR